MIHAVTVIKEAEVGDGLALAFPSISSCAAVIATVGATLVGAHFTTDLWAGQTPEKYTAKLLDKLVARIANRPIGRLAIIGFNQGHNPAKIRAHLNVQVGDCDAYDVARKDIQDMLVLALYQSATARARIEIKRTSKVAVVIDPSFVVTTANLFDGKPGAATLSNTRVLRKHFVGVT